MKRLKGILSLLFVVPSLLGCSKTTGSRLQREDWDSRVKENLNSLINNYGKDSNYYDHTSYAVFDFDNTSAIFDIEEQLLVYQLDTLSFNMTPTEMSTVLNSELVHPEAIIPGKEIHVSDLIEDIASAYTVLSQTYDITVSGLTETQYQTIQTNEDYLEFRSKARYLYDVIGKTESIDASYVWVCNFLTFHLTDEEVYSLASRSHSHYQNVETDCLTWTSPSNYSSKAGEISVSFMSGVSMTENVKELYQTLNENGIDVWICSASEIKVVQAAIDIYGVHDYVKGVAAMTINKDESGKHVCGYDYTTGYSSLAESDGSWTSSGMVTKCQTAAEGKVTAITNAIAPLYQNKGPIAGFMDSSGDFNFCTEFNDMKLVVCFNRANRSIQEGAGLVAIAATVQKDQNIDLTKANSNGDTLYLLQGRDENGKRTLRASDQTLCFGEQQEKLFKNEDNFTLYHYVENNDFSLQNFFNTYSISTAAQGSPIGIAYGYLSSYRGYHSVK